MIDKLYIIGNGFDIHHDIWSCYSEFQKYCKKADNNLYVKLENFYENQDLLWSDFEMELANISTDVVLSEARILHPNWNTEYSKLYAFIASVQDEVDYLYINIGRCFREWVEQLGKGNRSKCLYFNETNSFFLSFNYTNTLEDLYNISDERILYIHGKALKKISELVFGHHYTREEIESMIHYDNELEDEPMNEIVGFLCELQKKSKSIIADNNNFFTALRNVKAVYVLGHSLADVDYPYFEKVKESVTGNASWVVSVFNEKDINNASKLKLQLGIPDSLFKMINLNNLSDEFTPTIFN